MELSKAAEERLTECHSFCLRMEHLQKGSTSLLTKRDNTAFALAWQTRKALSVVCVTAAQVLLSLVLNQNNKTATTMINHLLCNIVYPAN